MAVSSRRQYIALVASLEEKVDDEAKERQGRMSTDSRKEAEVSLSGLDAIGID